MSVNRQYKDGVFTLLFNDLDTLRELYSALKGIPVDPSIPITINTLEDALFMGRINDISFEIGDMLVLVLEHQSTINPNMPLRILLYIAKVYEKILNRKNRESIIYTKTKLIIPRPEFIVLYNGTDPYPDEKVLNLSDAFADAASLGLPKDTLPALELTVKVYNINHGHNRPIVTKSEKLNEYSAFIAKVREYEQPGVELQAAVTAAVRYCIEHNILRDFLYLHGSEVINMLVTEWNLDTALKVSKAEGIAEGEARGIVKGEARGIVKGEAKGEAKGIVKGVDQVLELIRQGITSEAEIRRHLDSRNQTGSRV